MRFDLNRFGAASPFFENHGTILKFAPRLTPELRNAISFWQFEDLGLVKRSGAPREIPGVLDVFEELFSGELKNRASETRK